MVGEDLVVSILVSCSLAQLLLLFCSLLVKGKWILKQKAVAVFVWQWFFWFWWFIGLWELCCLWVLNIQERESSKLVSLFLLQCNSATIIQEEQAH